MTKQATLLIGLPGSGKTYLGKNLTGFFIDDPKEKPELNHDKLVIADPNLCMENVRKKAISYLQESGYEVSFIYFENDPKQCLKNVENRNDGRKVENTINILTKMYNIPKGITPLKVYQGDN